MQLYTLMGILFLHVVTFVASQTDQEEGFEFYAVSNSTKQRYVHSAAYWGQKFGADLTKEIAKKNSNNFVYSSLNTLLGLTILSIGARRHTEQVMRSKMGFEPRHIPRKVAYNEFLHRLGSYRGLDFEIANALFLPRMTLEPTVVEAIEIALLSTVKRLDFTKPNETSAIVNQWCEQHTRGHIRNIVQPADFNVGTSLVLVSAIHFTGAWLENFDSNKTRDMPFYCADGKERPVKTMIGRQLLRYSEHAPTNSKIVELPFKGSDGTHNMSMFLILPNNKDGATYVAENWEKIKPTELFENGKLSTVTINLPKILISDDIDLIEPLKNLGLGNIFDPARADFGGFFPPPEPYLDTVVYPPETLSRYPGFYVNKIVQKARIEIHEGNLSDSSVRTSEYMISSVYSQLTESVEFIANHTFFGTIVTTGEDPITVFTFRYSGIAAPTSLIDSDLEIF